MKTSAPPAFAELQPPVSVGGDSIAALRLAAALAFVGFCMWAIWQFLNGNETGALCALAVVGVACLPGWLWLTRRGGGYPLFPLFAFTYAYSFGLQFLTNQEILASSTPAELWGATWPVVAFLALGTWVWQIRLSGSPSPRKPKPDAYVIRVFRAEWVLMALLGGYAAFSVADVAGWLQGLGSLYSVARAVCCAPGLLSSFALFYFMGRGRLSAIERALACGLLLVLLPALSSGLFLIQTITVWFVAVVGYAIGSGRVPWLAIVPALPIFFLLHSGKSEMRAKYWGSSADERWAYRLSPQQYPQFFSEWLSRGWKNTAHFDSDGEETPSLLQRASLLQMFLLLRDKSPATIPFLDGTTYLGIPELLVPRLILPNRLSPTDYNAILSVRYGLQEEDDVQTTSIGWGLFNEAYANFGIPGTLGIGALMAIFLAWVTKYTDGYPVYSLRGLFAVLVLTLCLQSEYTLAFFVTVLAQSSVALGVLCLAVMRKEPLSGNLEPLSRF